MTDGILGLRTFFLGDDGLMREVTSSRSGRYAPVGPWLLGSDVASALRSERSVRAVMTAQREHFVMMWCCLACKADFDSQQEADEHPFRMGLAALTGGDDD